MNLLIIRTVLYMKTSSKLFVVATKYVSGTLPLNAGLMWKVGPFISERSWYRIHRVYLCVLCFDVSQVVGNSRDHNQRNILYIIIYVPVVPSRQLAALAWDGSLPPALGPYFSFMHRPLAPAADPPGGPGATYVPAALSPIASRYRCATATARAACLH